MNRLIAYCLTVAASLLVTACSHTPAPQPASKSGESRKFIETPKNKYFLAKANTLNSVGQFTLAVLPKDGTCPTKRDIEVLISDGPSHGQITVLPTTRKQPLVPSGAVGVSTACSGKTVDAKELKYQPSAGFTGTDKFTVKLSVGGKSEPGYVQTFNYTIEVK